MANLSEFMLLFFSPKAQSPNSIQCLLNIIKRKLNQI